jgi:hypothetical protein
MWSLTYFLGPWLALLPARWRKALPFAEAVELGPATVISGLGELVVVVIVGMYWYSYSMTTWVAHGLDAVLSGRTGPAEVTDHAIGFMAYLVWATHPFTWIVGYFFLEGAARLCGAAFTGHVMGTLPLFLADKIYGKIFRRNEPLDAVRANAPEGNFRSAMRDKLLVAKSRGVSDEVSTEREGADELLRVRASRPKVDWEPPRIVRYQDSYYRLETYTRVSGPRPFLYTLRKLPAGVPSRSVLVYSPD